MKTRFFSFDELKKYLQTEKLAPNLLNFEYMGIASIADLLHFVEEVKKGIIADKQIYWKRLGNLLKSGYVNFPELDENQLSESLFEITEDTFELWDKAANKNISPRYSLSLLALKLTEQTFWTEEVFEEMLDCYENIERNDHQT